MADKGSKVGTAIERTDATVSLAQRLWGLLVSMSPITTGVILTWATKLFRGAAPVHYYLSALFGVNLGLMAVVWMKAIRTNKLVARIDPADIVAEKRRKRAQVDKWRRMVAKAATTPGAGVVKMRDLLIGFEDYLSLEPRLSEETRAGLGCEPDPDEVRAAVGDLSRDIARIEKEWGLD